VPNQPVGPQKGYTNLIARLYPEDEDLRLAAGKVQATLDSEGWRIMTALLDELHSTYYKNLLLGHASMRGVVPSQAEFARATGFLAGIEQPQAAAEAFELALQAMNERNQSNS